MRRLIMKKSVFFCLAALILLGGAGQAEVSDKKPAIGKKTRQIR